MRRDVAPHQVSVSETFEATTFSFDASAEAFKIISDNLYSRPIEAVIRELACNAYDSHVKAGKADVPIHVRFPSRLDDTFFVQDFGTGLTPEEIRDVYTVVFKSDKTKTNELTGCFGLGSKTPFSVVSQFSVESVVNGRKWIYSAYLNERRIPTIADMSKGGFSTDEPNGVKVSFPIPKNMIWDFEDAATRVFRYFKVKPRITGIEIVLEDHDYTFSEEGLYGLRRERYGHSRRPKAIMGNVCYEIDMPTDEGLLPGNLDLYFELGDLVPTPSREHLQYDAKTKKAIEERYQKFLNSFAKHGLKQIDSANNLWEARVLLRKALSECTRWPRFVTDLGQKATWQGQLMEVSEALAIPHSVRSFYTRSKGVVEKGVCIAGLLHRPVTFYISDEIRGSISKVGYVAEFKTDNHVLLSLEPEERREQIEMLTEAGAPPEMFVKTSTLDKRPAAQRNGTHRSSVAGKYKVLKQYSGGCKTLYWRELRANEELPENAYYVFASRGSWGHTVDNLPHHPEELMSVIEGLKFLGLDKISIYGVVPSAKKSIPTNWQPIDELRSVFSWILEDKSVAKMCSINDFHGSNWLDKAEGCCYNLQEIADEKLRDMLGNLRMIKQGNKRGLFAFRKSLIFFGLSRLLDKSWAHAEEEVLSKKYPMMEHLQTYSYGHSKQALGVDMCEYFNLVHCKGDK